MDKNEYAEKHSSSASPLLVALERETHLKLNKPQMLTGHLQGRFLAMISHLLKPKRILEIGTYSGYGCLCLAEGLAADGLIYSLEISEENAWLAKKYFAQSPFVHQIKLRIGPAMESLADLDETWDLVYIDADKQNNMDYFRAVWPNLRQGGMLLIDNVFARDGVWKDAADQKPFERAVSEMNTHLSSLADGLVIMLPIRDGITCVMKNNLT